MLILYRSRRVTFLFAFHENAGKCLWSIRHEILIYTNTDRWPPIPDSNIKALDFSCTYNWYCICGKCMQTTPQCAVTIKHSEASYKLLVRACHWCILNMSSENEHAAFEWETKSTSFLIKLHKRADNRTLNLLKCLYFLLKYLFLLK